MWKNANTAISAIVKAEISQTGIDGPIHASIVVLAK